MKRVILVKEQVLAILTDIHEDVDFEGSTSLITDGLLTSFDIISLVAELDEAFDIEIPVSEVKPENFNSVTAICNMVFQIMGE